MSAPIYSGVSGKVKRLDEIVSSNGRFDTVVVIETDGQQAVWEGVKPPWSPTRTALWRRCASAAAWAWRRGLPTSVKLNVDPNRVHAIIINGAECEPT